MTHPALSSLNPFIRAASQGAFAGVDIASDERDIAGHAANQRSEPGEAGVSGSIPERSTTFHPDLAALAVWLDEPPLFLRTRPTIRYADESRDFLAWFRVFFA